jgi:hypothetical protein
MYGRKRGASQGEKEGGGKEREGGVACRGCSRESSWRWSGKQEVATLAPAQDTQEVAVPAKKTRTNLRIAP